jgi:hypothetical protein
MVQSTHGWNETDGFARFPFAREQLLRGGNSFKYYQDANALWYKGKAGHDAFEYQ